MSIPTFTIERYCIEIKNSRPHSLSRQRLPISASFTRFPGTVDHDESPSRLRCRKIIPRREA
ncbi:unnamed protein product [Chondrus crispus]|uniref:Uncharacterized protein n=1 Tax=Chondrus crispus TaxID=2769 RepID=R7Q3Q2_CHOCR|nr:unnamed protein product [Chondrus crispus]CDF32110.1 unnamed protein product [Chondrus crispus]|eukprot:XP_005711775.1 unnamed protein product [Chondrus crispus]